MKRLIVLIMLFCCTAAFANDLDYRGAWKGSSQNREVFIDETSDNCVVVKDKNEKIIRVGRVQIINENKIKVANGDNIDDVEIYSRKGNGNIWKNVKGFFCKYFIDPFLDEITEDPQVSGNDRISSNHKFNEQNSLIIFLDKVNNNEDFTDALEYAINDKTTPFEISSVLLEFKKIYVDNNDNETNLKDNENKFISYCEKIKNVLIEDGMSNSLAKDYSKILPYWIIYTNFTYIKQCEENISWEMDKTSKILSFIFFTYYIGYKIGEAEAKNDLNEKFVKEYKSYLDTYKKYIDTFIVGQNTLHYKDANVICLYIYSLIIGTEYQWYNGFSLITGKKKDIQNNLKELNKLIDNYRNQYELSIGPDGNQTSHVKWLNITEEYLKRRLNGNRVQQGEKLKFMEDFYY